MNFRRVIKSYKLLVLLSFSLASLAALYIVQSQTITDIEQSSLRMQAQVRKLHISESKDKIDTIDEIMNRMKFPVYDSAGARSWLLKVMEEFKKQYDAKIVSPIVESGSSHISVISFSYTPENPNDLIKLLHYLKNSISPIYTIESVDFKEKHDVRTVSFKLSVTQPYFGGSYDF